MRKDVRFGLTIGGILVLVLVVWLVLADHFGPKPLQDLVVQPPQTNDANSSPQPAVAPQTQPVLTELPSPTTEPTAAEAAPSPSRDWDSALATGQMPRNSSADGSPATQPISLSATIDTPGGGEATQAAAYDPPATQPITETMQAGRSVARTHKVASGESFYTIAASVYGDGSLYTRLEDANPNVDAQHLRIGTVLNVPDLDAGPSRLSTPADDSPQPQIDSSHSYRVQSSDTLVAIARKLYGKASAWQKIYDANHDVIGENPARLKVGMLLRLPEPPTVH